jgi:hypothetical protein
MILTAVFWPAFVRLCMSQVSQIDQGSAILPPFANRSEANESVAGGEQVREAVRVLTTGRFASSLSWALKP